MTHTPHPAERECLERCYPGGDNCGRREDGTWDCETHSEGCREYCRREFGNPESS